ncbi:unnamed protein product [Trifolium pratense]|uniref:Uncharacterized protein n=1 Tax=Trifolium pratense TaxID=57577 RepID=A0ACB0JL27_TRIPR|nr:unnamed protein product [Trifolium pratense]
MIRINNIGFLAIQETKLEVITESLCCSLWGSSDCDWVFLPSEGRSGGILSIWSDFNAVCRGEERSGINNADGVTWTEIIEFHHFLEELELVDLPLLGMRFTWYQASGRAMSKIDRILISDEWASIWGNGSLWALPRDVSDHCPLILKYSHQECGPKPFSVEGWIGFVLKEELKGLKFVLREWNNLEYGGMEARIGGLVMEIQDLDSKGETMGLSRQEVSSRKEKFGELWKFLKSKEALIFQISRSKWLKEGDCNTKFFHGCIKARSKLNSISAIRVDDVWLESPDQIKAVVSSFFANHVSDTPRARPKLDGVVELDMFKGFSLGRTPVVISHLQYADDTLCIGEASVNNLWSLKAILRVFEMASGLKVNFWKSGLIGVNVSSTFMEMTCTFLNCRFGSIPFKYLGLPIGANPRRIST